CARGETASVYYALDSW
nr:immunoglobulin heavy chain junction region [Macaca mulatta]MOX61561.1 immunoglobulin heavy chain junction region [Macaca mulatta]MOX62253.1 immunoglobulin heavy chain junction region [Macaca mulatta]MOX63329.1 immunoglobulin heavy chain junction region [Macaca mulatta]MOX63948.1 immunoglobulin heavy chain junction region [Macaca mulatta]